MQSRKDWGQEELFVSGSLRDLVPEDHLLRQVDAVLELDWLHEALAERYCQDNGRPCIDPEAALRLMLAGFFEGIVHDRKLMRRAQTDLAFRWFCGYGLHERLPHHSSLTRIRQRWGAELFEQIFKRTVCACVNAGLVGGKNVHIDATLIRADVSWESLTSEHMAQVQEANAEDSDEPAQPQAGAGRGKKPQKRSKSDPDARMARSRKSQRLEPSYKQHTACDDSHGVVVDVSLSSASLNEGTQLIEQCERIQENTGIALEQASADASYASGSNYAALEAKGIEAIIPPQPTPNKGKAVPLSRFKYDPQKQQVRCPRGKKLKRTGRHPNGWRYSARAKDCKNCPLRNQCLSARASKKVLVIREGYEAMLRARRRKAKGWSGEYKEQYKRHRWRIEGAHGEAKTQHGLHRAARRGIDNLRIQSYLTAAVMNLKRLAKAQTGQIPPHKAPLRLLNALWRTSFHPKQANNPSSTPKYSQLPALPLAA